MIHHFLASVIITAVTNLYLLAPFKDVLNLTVKFQKLLFQLNQLKKNWSITGVCFKQEIMLFSRTLRVAFLWLGLQETCHVCVKMEYAEFMVLAIQRKVFQLV